MNVRAPRCPGCDGSPALALDVQYFCDNEACQVVIWDPRIDPALFKAAPYQVIDLPPANPGQP